MGVFAQSIHALRTAPGFTILVVLILALGIGANTAIFTLINAALLRPLPYRDPAALVFVDAVDRSTADQTGCLSYPHYTLIASHNRSFASIAAFTSENYNFRGHGEPVQVQAARVSPNFFALLGTKPALGRSFQPGDSDQSKLVVILSDSFWRRYLNSNPEIVGQSITLDAKPYTVVGILPSFFQFAPLGSETEVWTTHFDELNLMTRTQLQAGACYLDAVARLRPGFSLAASQAEMDVLNQQYLREFPKLGDADPKRPVEVTPLQTKLVSSFRPTFFLLSGSVGLILLIACANVAGLLLARGLERRREIAVRVALGAARRQIMVQVLAESLILAGLSGMLGFALSVASARGLSHFLPGQVGQMNKFDAGLDIYVLIFAVLVSALTGILFGLLPALQSSNPDVSAALREEGRTSAGGRSRTLMRRTLVAAQIALSVVLLIGAALLIRSFLRLVSESPGFQASGVLTLNLTLPPSKYSRPIQMIDFYDQLLARTATLPGVDAAAVSSALPLNVARITPVLIEGQPTVPLAERPLIIIQTFTAAYLSVMRIPLLRGRFFEEFDRQDSARVIVVNHSFAARYFPGENAVGKHVWLGRMTTPSQIVGVIGNIKNVSFAANAEPEIDIPFSQLPWARMHCLVRASNGDAKDLADAVRLQISKIDPDQPATAVQTLGELLADARSQPRTIMILLTALAVFAFLLAMTGLYGVISYSVAQRTQEMGVRTALGATRRNLLALILGEGALLASAGILMGVGCALAATRLLTTLVYGVSTTDPLTFAVIPILLLAAALLACLVPALRAASVAVIQALRQQ